MSLFGTIQLASTALQANDIAMQVVGQNISNANTPGYLREVTNFVPGPTQEDGTVVLGTGVRVQSVTQVVDQFLEQSLRSANSNQANADTLQSAYTNLENSIGALSTSGGVDSSLTNFFNSISNVLNQPGNGTSLDAAVTSGQTLVQSIQSLDSQVVQQRANLDGQVQQSASQINSLTSDIANLNQQIIAFGPGTGTQSDVVGLTDQRQQDLDSLSQIVGIQATTQTNGAVDVYAGGDYLVQDTLTQQVQVVQSTDRGQTISNLQIAGINAPLQATTGQLAGLINARDTVLGGFEDQLNNFSSALVNAFNSVYASGQGTVGYSTITSRNPVVDPSQNLNATGLSLTPVNGSFDITTTNQNTGLQSTTNIPVNLLGTGSQTTLNSLAGAINNISGLQATISDGQLTIASTDPNITFAFSNDTSNTLAGLGLNTFFTGSTASDIGVNPDVVNNVNLFAASQGGVGVDTNNAVQLANLGSQPLTEGELGDSSSPNPDVGQSIMGLFNTIVDNVSQASANATAAASSADTVQQTLTSHELSVSGVNIDEETVNLLQYQYAYEASAKVITTVNTLLNTLLQM